MTYPFYIFFGILPSLIWLLFFLRKDSHPESNQMILKIFFFGMLAAFPAILLELGFAEEVKSLNLPPILIQGIYLFLGVALIEEGLKYLVVKKMVLKDPELDEPTDIMLYMIISALGFAALENLLILFPLNHHFFETFLTSGFRFVGATFLHALCSGTIGYFLALSFFDSKNRFKLIAKGLGIAILLHGLYNFSIIEVEGVLKLAIPAIILLGLAVFVSLGFRRLKKLKSICQLK